MNTTTTIKEDDDSLFISTAACGSLDEIMAVLKRDMISMGGWTDSDASEALDLARHAYEQAVQKVEEITRRASSPGVFMQATTIAAQLIRDWAATSHQRVNAAQAVIGSSETPAEIIAKLKALMENDQ